MNALADSEFVCERSLRERNADLHTRYRGSVFAMDRLLTNYKAIFPYYTNHSFEHSVQVIRYCNMIAGEENVAKMNADELYILLMGAALHDVGMGVSTADFHETKDQIVGFSDYFLQHPFNTVAECTRVFHQEFSAQFIRKYRDLFEIPSEGHLYGICQIARGHRKLNLLDETEFGNYRLENGSVVRLAYLAALVKLADELDITADRNLLFDYSKHDRRWSAKQQMCFDCHKALREIAVEGETIVLRFSAREPAVYKEILAIEKKVQKTFSEFVAVVKCQTDFRLCQQAVRFVSEI